MDVNKFINGMCAVFHEASEAEITILLSVKGEFQEAAVCGFEPNKNSERLEEFVAMLTHIAQIAITDCGHDDVITISGTKGTINVREVLDERAECSKLN